MPLPPLAPPARLLTRAAGLARALPGLALLVVLLAAYNIGQVLSLLALPVSRRAFLAYNRGGARLWWRLFGLLVRALHGARVEVTGDRLPRGGNLLVVANHQQMADICFLALLADRQRAAGDLKWFVKRQVRYVPLLGWGMAFLDNLFVERSWSRDRRSIEATFARLRRDGARFWVVLFAEGTRATAEKIAAGGRLWQRQGREPALHVLPPRTRGFVATLAGLAGALPAVCDLTIAYEGGVPSLWQFILGYAPVARVHVRLFGFAELPVSDEDRAAWLFDRYALKDRILDRHYAGVALDTAAAELDPPPSVRESVASKASL
ncbi:MAG TPA: 1-acyl-sn-glycerol-3-phosphate acyltransferase [Polyangia bacterium]|nr:1-acyl-sn-glycerol-3-phosphate acyltransferase [Polyangia bacterium]